MLQLVLTVIIFMIIVIPIGNYLYHIASGQRTFADPVFDRVDGGIFKVCGIHRQGHELEAVYLGAGRHQRRDDCCRYLILRIQSIALFNPNGIGNMEPTLASTPSSAL